MFQVPVDVLYGRDQNDQGNFVTPFAESQDMSIQTPGTLVNLQPDVVWYWGNIPAKFGEKIFDETEHEIKHLVLTNTWPRFVREGHAEHLETHELFGRVKKYVAAMGRAQM